jgi:integrase
MARTIRNAKIDSKSARLKLIRRREPHWTLLKKGHALGYRKGASGGTWIARVRDDSGRSHYGALGQSDDLAEANDQDIFSFGQAQEKALQFFKNFSDVAAQGYAVPEKPITVTAALEEYFTAYVRRGGKSLNRMRSYVRTHIESELGNLPLSKLTRKRLEQWHGDIAKSQPASRGKLNQPAVPRKTSRQFDARKRSATANRVLTILKAALNHARNEGHVASDAAWDRVKAFRGVDFARQRYLSDDEGKLLVAACSAHFRKLVMAALLTGCRYGELCRLTCEDFNPDSKTLLVGESKSGKSRHIALPKQGSQFFDTETKGRASSANIFVRPNGSCWSNSDQQRPMQDAVKAAHLPAITFHGLRHTYASRLAMKAVPLAVIAKQLGHSDTRMVEKHYGHLAPNYVADTIRAAFGEAEIELYSGENISSAA